MNVIEQEFDALAPEYESNRLSAWYQAHGAELLEYVPPLEEGDILDIGCGTGHFLRQYLTKHPHARGVGLDLSYSMIDEARRRADAEGIANVTFLKGNWEDIGRDLFSSYDFSVIVCANAFHYFTDPQAATGKMFHLINDGGSLYILERDKSRSLLTFLWGFLHRVWIKDHVIFYDDKEMLGMLVKAGFSNARVIRSIKRYFWKNKLFTSIVLLECHKSSKAEP